METYSKKNNPDISSDLISSRRSRFVATHTLFRVLAISGKRLDSWGSILAHGLTRVDIGGSYRPELRFLKIKLCLFVSQ